MDTISRNVGDRLSCEISVINGNVARNLLESTLFPRQRNLNEQNVQRLQDEMKNGWYVPGTPLMFAVLPDNTMYLLNGRHSLTALGRTPFTYAFTKIFVRVRNIEEAGEFYSRLDLQRVRSWHDAYRAAGLEERAGFNSAWLIQFGTAIRLIMRSFRSDHPIEMGSALASRQTQLEIFADYLPYARAYIDSIAHKNNLLSLPWKRGSVMSVGLELFRYQPQKAYEFFNGASADNGLLISDPRKRMLHYMGQSTAHTRANRNLISSAVSICWNAYFAGEMMHTPPRPSSVSRIILDGTPWNGSYSPFHDLLALASAKRGNWNTAFDVDYSEFTTGEQVHKDGHRQAHSAATPKKSSAAKPAKKAPAKKTVAA